MPDVATVLMELGQAQQESSQLVQELQNAEEETARTQNAFNKLQSDSKSWVNLPAWQKKNFFNWSWYKSKGELETWEAQQKFKKECELAQQETAEAKKQFSEATQEFTEAAKKTFIPQLHPEPQTLNLKAENLARSTSL